jgi:RNA polymerase sigma factor (sigma-70 family)
MACCDRDRDTAEDVLHDAYMLVIDGTARFDGRSALRTWLFGVIRRVAISRLRRERVRAVLRIRNEPRIARPSESASPDDRSMQEDRSLRTRTALQQLSARQREVLQLVFYHDMTIEEAAAVMNVSLGSARVHYHRGKVRMAALLASDRP